MKKRGKILFLSMMTGCGASNSLDGSIEELLPLDFAQTAITKQESILVVDYLNADEITLRLTVETEDLDLHDGAEVAGDSFVTSVRLQRATHDNGQFPDVDSGSVRFGRFEFHSGGHVAGEFDIAFEDGRLLLGVFDGTVEE